jgi:FkbM family methyltransferase
MTYNPYTKQALNSWHIEVTKHIGWIILHVGDYFLERNYKYINMIDIGCSTGRLVEIMNNKIPVKNAILIDAVSEVVDYAKEIFGEKYYYESCVLGNLDSIITLTLPEPYVLAGKVGINLGGATAQKIGLRYRENVPIKKFDTIWKEKYINFIPDLIKIDAEGLDIEVLMGMQDFLTHLKKKPVIVYEIAGLNASEQDRIIVNNKLNFLSDMGYKPLWENDFLPQKSCDVVITVENQ